MAYRTKLKTWSTIFIYVSIFFFAFYLVRHKDLHLNFSTLPANALIISFVLLWAGFIASALSWRNALAAHGIKIPVKKAIHSHGSSVLGKYIPGKIWVILGRAFPVAGSGSELQRVTLASLKEQLIYIFLGLLISFVPVLIVYPYGMITVILLVSLLLLGLLLFVPAVHNAGRKILKRMFKKEPDLPLISMKQALGISVYVLFYWSLWTAGFWFFLKAFATDAMWIQAFAFPLSVCYGVMAIIFPGGLGVREGIMTGFLVLTGMSPEKAAAISLLNRLWFITGELFIFSLAFLLRPVKRLLRNGN